MPQLPLDLLPVFNAQPGATLLLSPDWMIVGASDDYLAATLTERATIVGQYVFDAFPENPETPDANAVVNVRASLEQVMATKQPHEMPPQHYDVPDRTQPGRFVERHWQLRHTPVLNAQGQVQFIIQSVQDITARHHAERQLQQSQAREQAARAAAAQQRTEFQHFLEQAPVAVAVYQGPAFHIEMANATTLALWGRTLDQVLHRPVFEALPETATPEVVALFESVFTTGTPHTVYEQATTLHRHGRSEQVYWNVVFEPQRGADGRVSGIFTVGTDVTEQVRARQQLEQLNQELEAHVQARTHELEATRATTERQRRQWHELFMRAPAAICIFDGPEWVYEFVNPGYQAMFPGRKLLGKRLVDALPEVADQPLMAILHHVYDTGEPFQESEVLVPLVRTEDGPIEDIYFDLTYLARYDEAGQINGFVTYAYDVTQQVLARREREAQQQQLRAVFEQAPVAIFVLRGAEYVYEVVNPSMGKMLHSAPEQLLGRRYFDMFPALAGQGYRDLLGHVWRTGETYVAQEQAARMPHHHAGETGYYNFTYVALRDALGSITGIMCVAMDVTPQVRARQQVQSLNEELAAINEKLRAKNEELHQSNTQLMRTNVDLDTFVYTASHDLKAPINNIEGLVQVLEEETTAGHWSATAAHVLTLMQDAVGRFRSTLGHLTEITQLQSDVGATAPVDLATVIAEVELDLTPLLAVARARVQVEVAACPALPVPAKTVRSVIYNLLSNALKYRAPERPPIVCIRCRVEAQHFVLEVEDNGLGIDLARQTGLFGMFRRYHTHVEGAGVGLYMVKRMVEHAGGDIAVRSQLGVGSTFIVRFARSL
ncbi:PAS domain-containing sensor histidine kinase [Hymenobacter sp. BT507]|uniref:histidine kinase n=1 Tax=Hymenobacter citatus TaxID=2763506 RepID=A0ABR7MNX0_9BACT|nr:PAS domain-containing sensor histidine kinase [Hymenobacter citatus]MBC6612784.1 PAS domain-containing sensor histidine kinase [Hymenobacter citatus]